MRVPPNITPPFYFHVPVYKYKKCSRFLERLRISLFLLNAKTFFEPVNTSAGINELLTAGKERMALGTDFHTDILFCGTGMDNLAASTRNGRIYIFWMDSVFHFCFTSL